MMTTPQPYFNDPTTSPTRPMMMSSSAGGNYYSTRLTDDEDDDAPPMTLMGAYNMDFTAGMLYMICDI